MEVNKDEAERCIQIAIDALKSGHVERSEKFLRKAENLYPTQRAKDLLSQLHNTKNSTTDSNARNRRPNVKTTKDVPSEPSDYTQAQVDMVSRIKRCKDYYEVLNVTKESTDSEIKKSYKKLALQLHPDKNHAPGAVEAFKSVGNAVAVLTDAEKRKSYDLYGSEGRTNRSQTYYHHQNHEYEHAYDRGGSFESDFTAEEVFNMFFGGGFPQQRMHTQNRRYQQHHRESVQQPSLAFGLILVLIVVSMLSSFFTSDPVYSLSQSSRYPIRRNTIHLNIPYFVKDKFENEYQGSLARLENSVEEEYIATMKQACYRERSYREVMMAKARSFGSKSHLEQAQSMKMPSCENLARIGLTKYMPY
ncbi:dnaJ homolog subfamily B member 12-like [Bradysia coprophila]|uniref:dnaJ homolog subfamily B member 12-like n=1 Tax=Bradysia coprophila TaxID=38358 RepID=UPI00187DC768|nr:dnaJ homolog subfamily B member 12-like [Bradysia coprophila]